MTAIQEYKANGKLLLSGEYVVLDGAMALAVPTRFGQSMQVTKGTQAHLLWRSVDRNNQIWFEGEYDLSSGKYLRGTDKNTGYRLEQIWSYIQSVHPHFLSNKSGLIITTQLDFDRAWGLGTSSTLISNIANWANVNPYTLLENTFGGSGYDIACANSSTPILYQIQNGNPVSRTSLFSPSFKDNLYFIYLGQKQNSQESVRYYKEHVANNPRVISNISIISHRMVNATTASEFGALMEHHEHLMSDILNLPTVKEQRFQDFWGQIKSLGAWGGDFAMAVSQSSPEETLDYFQRKGYPIVFGYDEMVLRPN